MINERRESVNFFNELQYVASSWHLVPSSHDENHHSQNRI